MRIDRAVPDDADAIAAAHVESWREAYAGLPPPSLFAAKTVTVMAPRWRNSVTRGEAVFVVRDGDAIEGVACGGPRREAELCDFAADVRAIYLRRRVQGRRLGRALMAAMAADLLSRDLQAAASGRSAAGSS